MSNYPPGLSNGGYREDEVEHSCKNGHKWEADMFFELGGWFYHDEDFGPYCPVCGWGDTPNESDEYMEEIAYKWLVTICLESNDDQSGYDEASALAAVDSMLTEEGGSYNAVLAQLMGEE